MSEEDSREATLAATWLGRVDYRAAWAQQRLVHGEIAAGSRPHTLLLVEHPPVFTLGKRGGMELFHGGPGLARSRGAEIVQSDRGGLVTFHGPGQLIGYPLLNLAALGLDLNGYLRRLLETLAGVLSGLGLEVAWELERPGLFVGGRKVGAVGVRLSGGVTMHGFAINVATDLSWFDCIVPCGLPDVRATSIEQELAGHQPPGLEPLSRAVADALSRAFGLELRWSEDLLPGPI